MGTTLLRNAAFIATLDDTATTYVDGAILLRDNAIERIGRARDLGEGADHVIDATGLMLLPGLVNTHHHFYQTLTRNVPGAQDVALFDWLTRLYPLWARLTPEAIRVSSAIAMAELMLGGCTTASDHNYIWPNGSRIEDQLEAAADMGMRFHASRGSMSVGQSLGGLPPDSLVESEAAILRDSQRAIEQHHDAARFAMTRIALAPCSPFSVSPDLMRESIALARACGVHSHTHLAETLDEERYCKERFAARPVELAESLGWVGDDVWHAHMVHPSPAEISRLGASRTGVAHCPTSNMRLGSGIAPVRALEAAGARVGLGVDGSASNDASSMLDEARQTLLLHRVMGDPAALSAGDVLRMATRGGASVLGRDDIGYLAPGMAADIIGYRMDALGLAGGAVHDPLASLVFCRPGSVDLSIINGRTRIASGTFVDIDLRRLIARHNDIAVALVRDELR
ncbi:MAG TPA: 8-oxoguanine deaminase [Candidatus Baltobacteraceae bacterium]|nr:8-oxoguanine deaminase [Candidatus Baltobacteraceae bacterium]